MRIFFALLISTFLIGGTYRYIQFAESVSRPASEIQIDFSKGEYSVEFERSFPCDGDPILGTDSIKVMFKGEKVLTKSGLLDASEPLEIRPLEGVEVGENEIYIAANMSPNYQGLGVIKATIKRNDIVVTEKLLTSEEGLGTVSGPVVFVIEEVDSHDNHDH